MEVVRGEGVFPCALGTFEGGPLDGPVALYGGDRPCEKPQGRIVVGVLDLHGYPEGIAFGRPRIRPSLDLAGIFSSPPPYGPVGTLDDRRLAGILDKRDTAPPVVPAVSPPALID